MKLKSVLPDIVSESGKALGFGAGIPITLLLMNMLGNVSVSHKTNPQKSGKINVMV